MTIYRQIPVVRPLRRLRLTQRIVRSFQVFAPTPDMALRMQYREVS
jgi:hypothetical protein